MNNLKRIRKAKGLSQVQMAALLGITVSAYGKYELGQRSPTPEALMKLADHFNVSVDYLLDRVDDTGMIPTSIVLSDYERALLSVVKLLSKDDQYQVLGFAQGLAR